MPSDTLDPKMKEKTLTSIGTTMKRESLLLDDKSKSVSNILLEGRKMLTLILSKTLVKMNMIVSCITTAGLVASGTVTTDGTPTAAHIGAVATTTAKQKYGPTFFPWLSALMVRARSRGWRRRRLLG